MTSLSAADERRLVDRARAGDPQAFGELVFAHQAFVYNLALRALADAEEAQDVAQEAFLRAWRGLPSFRGAAGFRTWLYRIVMNLCYNRAPQLKQALAALSLDADDNNAHPFDGRPAGIRPMDERLASGNPSPESELEAGELRALLRQRIDELAPTYRLLTLLRYHQGLSYEEIAEATGMPLGTVKTGLFRAHARLRVALMAGALEAPTKGATR
jgi:RNA polymerase sigma-70 factor (ECF subfamily)